MKELKSKKLRKTKLRVFLLKTLLDSAKPLAVENLLNVLSRAKNEAHKTSVYRQLSVLKNEKIIREVQFGENKKRYEIYPDNHHHHLVCVDCGHVEDVNAEKDLTGLEKKIFQDKKFKVVNHSLEFFGICVNCKQ